MPQVEQSIEISAPPDAVFTLIADQPERIAEWWHEFEQQRVTPPPTAVGSVARYVYNMMGIRIKASMKCCKSKPERISSSARSAGWTGCWIIASPRPTTGRG
jgi:hypothetical protein